MKTFRFISVLLLSAGVVISSCSKDSLVPEQEPEPVPTSKVKTYKVTIKSKNGVDTKASLTDNGTSLSFSWADGDKLKVTKGGVSVGTLEADVDEATATTRFVGSLTGEFETGNTLELAYLSPSYNSQDGTLNGIANGCDYAVATVTVSSVNNDQISTTDATFDLQQAFVKFTLKNKVGGANLVPTSLTIRVDGMSDIAVTPTSVTNNVVYVALAGITNKDINITAVSGGIIYTCKATNVTFQH